MRKSDRSTIAETSPSALTGNGWQPAVMTWAPRSGASVTPQSGRPSRQCGHREHRRVAPLHGTRERRESSRDYRRGCRLQPGREMAADGTSTMQALDDRNLGSCSELGGTGLCFSPDSRLVATPGREPNHPPGRGGNRPRDRSASKAPTRLKCYGRRSVLMVHAWCWSPIVSRPSASGTCGRSASDSPRWTSIGTRRPIPDDDPAAASLPPLPPLQVDLGPRSRSNTFDESTVGPEGRNKRPRASHFPGAVTIGVNRDLRPR